YSVCWFYLQAEDGIRHFHVTGVQTCALPIWRQPIVVQRPIDARRVRVVARRKVVPVRPELPGRRVPLRMVERRRVRIEALRIERLATLVAQAIPGMGPVGRRAMIVAVLPGQAAPIATAILVAVMTILL